MSLSVSVLIMIFGLFVPTEEPHVIKAAYGNLNDITWSGELFVAVGDSGLVATSANGLEWKIKTSVVTMLFDLKAITWSGSRFIAVGTHGAILTSANGSDWTAMGIPALEKPVILNAVVCHSPDQFLAVGDRGIVVRGFKSDYSPNPSVSEYDLHGITVNDKKIIAVGEHGTIIECKNGTRWAATDKVTRKTLYGIEVIGDRYLAVGDKGIILESFDGSSWTSKELPWPMSIHDIAGSSKKVVVVGDVGFIATSSDFKTWTRRSSPVMGWLSGITWNGEKFIAVGRLGAILFSEDGIKWTKADWLDRTDVIIRQVER